MTTFEKYTLGLQLAGVFVTGLSAVFIVLQIWFASRGLQLGHDRQRRQATVEFLLFHIRPQWRTGRKKIEDRWGKERLTEESVNKILADDDARDEISRVAKYP